MFSSVRVVPELTPSELFKWEPELIQEQLSIEAGESPQDYRQDQDINKEMTHFFDDKE